MKKKEIFDLEQNNEDKIYLFKEGTFWIAYEKSAHRFVKNIREYSVKKKYIQTVGEEMASLGFPDSALAGISAEVVERSENRIVLTLPEQPGDEDFDRWKAETPLYIPRAKAAKPEAALSEPVDLVINNHTRTVEHAILDVVCRIRNFNLESKTPMECMLFVSDLKNTLRHEIR